MATTELEVLDIPAKFFTVKLVRFRNGKVGVAAVITDPEAGAVTIGFSEEESEQAWQLMQRMSFRAESMNDAGR